MGFFLAKGGMISWEGDVVTYIKLLGEGGSGFIVVNIYYANTVIL